MSKHGTIMGLDLGDKYGCFCVLNRRGEVAESGRVSTTPEALEKMFGKNRRMCVVMEAGTHSPWMSRLLTKLGHETVVANPARLAMISQSRRKNDQKDAEKLARIARADRELLSLVEHRSEQAQRDLSMLRCRDALVKARTMLVNQVRGTVKVYGQRLLKCSTNTDRENE